MSTGSIGSRPRCCRPCADVETRAAALTELLGGAAGLHWFRAPGRVNLIGDHTDYHEGFVLPLAVDRDCVIAARRRDDARVTVRSVELRADGSVDVAADGSDAPSTVEPRWGRYVAGVVRALADAGRRPVGLDAAVTSTVPVGAGLSSSAALEVAVALALAGPGGLPLPPRAPAPGRQPPPPLPPPPPRRRVRPPAAGRRGRGWHPPPPPRRPGRPPPAGGRGPRGGGADRPPRHAGGARGPPRAAADARGQPLRRPARRQ